MAIFWDRTDLSAAAKLVGLYLGDVAQESDFSLPFEAVRAWSGVTAPELCAALRELEDADLVFFRRSGDTLAVVLRPLRRALVDRPSNGDSERKRWRQRILEKTYGRCFYCGCSEQEAAHQVEHMHPRAQGGRDAIANLVGACIRCNAAKGARTVDEYRSLIAARDSRCVSQITFFGETEMGL